MVNRDSHTVALWYLMGWLAVVAAGCSSQPPDSVEQTTRKVVEQIQPPEKPPTPLENSSACGGLGTLSLDQAVSLLKGRAAAMLPRGITQEESLSKLFWSSNEDVLELDIKEVKVTFRLEEIYQTRAAGMPQDGERLAAAQPSEGGKIEIKPVTLADGSEGVMWLRKSTDPMYGALYFFDRQGVMLVASLLAGSVGSAATEDLACGPAFERIFTHIEPGSTPLDLTSDSRRLMGNPLPPGYFRYNVSYGDTTIEYAGKPSPVGKLPPLAGVYDGLHPQPINKQKADEIIEGELMGHPAQWVVHVRKPDAIGRPTHRADAQRTADRTKLHGFASAGSREELLELMALLK